MHFDRTKALPRAIIGFIACVAVIGVMAAPAAAQSAGWQPGPGAILDNTYTGYIDVPISGATVPGTGQFGLSGWFVDTTAQGWAGADHAEVWLGTMDGGGKKLADAIVAQNRPDVAAAMGNPYYAASGINAIIPGSSVPGGPQTLNLYVHTGGKGWWYKSVNVNGGGSGATAPAPAPGTGMGAGGPPILTVTQPTEGANVSAKGSADYDILGTATDPTYGPGAIDRVDVWILGEPDTGTQLGTTTPASDTTWSMTFKPTQFPSTHVNIYVFAHSKVTGKTTEVVRGFNIQG